MLQKQLYAPLDVRVSALDVFSIEFAPVWYAPGAYCVTEVGQRQILAQHREIRGISTKFGCPGPGPHMRQQNGADKVRPF